MFAVYYILAACQTVLMGWALATLINWMGVAFEWPTINWAWGILLTIVVGMLRLDLKKAREEAPDRYTVGAKCQDQIIIMISILILVGMGWVVQMGL